MRTGTVPAEPQLQDYNVLTARTPDAAAGSYSYGAPAMPIDYNYTPGTPALTARSAAPADLPNIRADVKRQSNRVSLSLCFEG